MLKDEELETRQYELVQLSWNAINRYNDKKITVDQLGTILEHIEERQEVLKEQRLKLKNRRIESE